MQENNTNQPNEVDEKRLQIKAFNQKRRNMSIIWFIGLLIIGVVFLIAGVNTFNTVCIVFGVLSIVCGIVIIVADFFTQNEVYEVFTPEYYVHVKNGKEGERVYWSTVFSTEYSTLMEATSSRSQIGRVTNFIIDYKVKDESGNYVLKRASAYVPQEQLTLVQSVIPVLISGGKYIDERYFADDGADDDFEWDEQSFEEANPDGVTVIGGDKAEEPISENTVKEEPNSENTVKVQKPISQNMAASRRPYVKIPPSFIGMLVFGAILAVTAIITYIVYAFAPVEPLIIVSMVASFSAIICVELSLFYIRILYRYGYNPYKRKLVALNAVLFCAYLGISIYSIVTYISYIPKLICIIAFVLGTVVFLAETVYYAVKNSLRKQ